MLSNHLGSLYAWYGTVGVGTFKTEIVDRYNPQCEAASKALFGTPVQLQALTQNRTRIPSIIQHFAIYCMTDLITLDGTLD
jgi:hypothetical protein